MGAAIDYSLKENIYEPIGNIIIRYNGQLRATTVDSHIAWLIDELPALAIAMATAEGISSVHNVEELRVKESDRISTTLDGLKRAGIQTIERESGYDIIGGTLKEATINSYGDHRIAMSFAIAGIRCGMTVEDVNCIETSFPNFCDILRKISEVKDGD
jgi:3-phosphoshikimate 1-carboxyvinyltransferase